jgi:hypothetical protein
MAGSDDSELHGAFSGESIFLKIKNSVAARAMPIRL